MKTLQNILTTRKIKVKEEEECRTKKEKKNIMNKCGNQKELFFPVYSVLRGYLCWESSAACYSFLDGSEKCHPTLAT